MTERVCDIMVCEAMMRNLVPTARAEMVCRLVTHQGVPQTEVARRLGILIDQGPGDIRGPTTLQ